MGKEKKLATKRNPVSATDKELMMTVLIRNPVAFESARDMLNHEHFGAEDLGYSAVWRAATDFYDNYGDLPDLEFLKAETLRLIAEDPGMLLTDDTEEVEEFLLKAFNPEWGEDIETNVNWAQWACDTLQKFMEESLARRLQDELRSVKGRIAENMPEILELASAEAAQIATVTSSSGIELFPNGWDIDGGINVGTTGVPFFDAFLAGGHAPGEVYGLLGPYGSAKTTLAVMLCVEAARQAHSRSLAGNEDHEYVFLASYEAGIAELRLRTLSYAAQIRRESLEGMGTKGLKALSPAAR